MSRRFVADVDADGTVARNTRGPLREQATQVRAALRQFQNSLEVRRARALLNLGQLTKTRGYRRHRNIALGAVSRRSLSLHAPLQSSAGRLIGRVRAVGS